MYETELHVTAEKAGKWYREGPRSSRMVYGVFARGTHCRKEGGQVVPGGSSKQPNGLWCVRDEELHPQHYTYPPELSGSPRPASL